MAAQDAMLSNTGWEWQKHGILLASITIITIP
jgi:hypothetical protein